MVEEVLEEAVALEVVHVVELAEAVALEELWNLCSLSHTIL